MDKKLEVIIQYLPGAQELEKIQKGDWIDLYAYEDYEYKIGDTLMVNLGVAMQLPEGYEAHIVPRSGTFKKYGLIQTNHIGIVDNSYCGPNDIWRMPVYCLTVPAKPANEVVNGKMHIKKGDRLCQFKIEKIMPTVEFTKVEKLQNEDRNGFGSTGA